MLNKCLQKRWYHATTKENWEKIKKEGVLWGIPNPNWERETFLARNWRHLLSLITYRPISFHNGDMYHLEVLLSVKYTPDRINDDYDPRSWEMRVTKPIPIQNVRFLKYIYE